MADTARVERHHTSKVVTTTTTKSADDGMTGFEFTAAMTDSLAWPLAAVGIALIFRRQLRGLIERVEEMTLFDQTAKFTKPLDKAEEATEKLEEAAPAPDPVPEPVLPLPIPPAVPPKEDAEESYMRQVREMNDLHTRLFVDPRFGMLQSYDQISRALHSLMMEQGLSDLAQKHKNSAPMMAEILLDKGVLPASAVPPLVLMHQMRNRAAHGETPNTADAFRFHDLAQRITRIIASIKNDPQRD